MTDVDHAAFPRPEIVAMFPTRGGWRGSCSCGWMEQKTHRSERECDKACAKHERKGFDQ